MERSWAPRPYTSASPAHRARSYASARLSRRSARSTRARLSTALLVSLVLVALFALMVGNAELVFGDTGLTPPLGAIAVQSDLLRDRTQVAGRQASELFLEYLETLIAKRG